MKFSIIIPVLNRVNVISRALDSACNQKFDSYEVLVIDNGSQDGTPEKVESNYPEVKIFHEELKGVGAARNKGIAESRGDWIVILDSDNEFSTENSLTDLDRLIKGKKNLDLLFTSNVDQNRNYVSFAKDFDSFQNISDFVNSGGEFSICAKRTWYQSNNHILVPNVIHELGLITYLKAVQKATLFISSAVVQIYHTDSLNRVSSIKKSRNQMYDLSIYFILSLSGYYRDINFRIFWIWSLKLAIYSKLSNVHIDLKKEFWLTNLIKLLLIFIPKHVIRKIFDEKVNLS